MRLRLFLQGLSLAVLLCAAAQMVCAQAMFVELLRPQSDDLGHYIQVASSGSYPVMGVVASEVPITRVTVAGLPAVLFPVNNYEVFGAPTTFPVVGFRARVFLEPFTPLRVTAVDQDGNFRDAAYLPDALATLQRVQFLRTLVPEDPFHQLRMANANVQVGNVDEVAALFDEMVEANPDIGVARHLRALALMDIGETDAAIEDLEWLADEVPEAMAPRLDLAIALHNAGDWDNAITEYYDVLDMQPASAEAHLLLGQAIRESGGSPVEAVYQQEEALEIDPTLAPAHYEVGLNLADQGDYNQAMYRFRQALQENPRSADAYLALAMVRYQRGQYRRAWQALDRASRWGAEIDPAFVAALSARHPAPYRLGSPQNYARPGW